MATTATGVRAARELDELYRAHAAEVFRYAYAVLGNRADAEDVTQTTFVNALRALERGEQPRKPTNWLITIAHNLMRQRFRQQQSRPREVELEHDVPAVEAADDAPSVDDLVRALQRIPPTQRQALVLRELEGRPYVEIAQMLDVSVSALEALLFRARRSLAEELENLVTCDSAELAFSRRTDGRLGRKERRRLLAHVDECTSCARVAARSMKHRRAFKALALLPLPFSLTLFKGTPSAYAAAGLPTIGAGTAAGAGAGLGAAGATAKLAVGLAAVAVAGGAGYEGVQAVRAPAPPARAAADVAAPRPTMPVERVVAVAAAGVDPVAAKTRQPRAGRGKPAAKPKRAATRGAMRPDRQARGKAQAAAAPERGRSTTAPGRTKGAAAPKAEPPQRERAKQSPRPDSARAAEPVRAKPTKPARATEPTKRARPTKPVETADPVEIVKAAEIPAGARPVKLPKPGKPR